MTRAATIHVHALFMRACAAALANGDAEARDHASQLMQQAEKIDPPPKVVQSGGAA